MLTETERICCVEKCCGWESYDWLSVFFFVWAENYHGWMEVSCLVSFVLLVQLRQCWGCDVQVKVKVQRVLQELLYSYYWCWERELWLIVVLSFMAIRAWLRVHLPTSFLWLNLCFVLKREREEESETTKHATGEKESAETERTMLTQL